MTSGKYFLLAVPDAKKKYHAKPLTTQGKIALAEAQAAKTKIDPLIPPNELGGSKLRSLPPPGEMTQEEIDRKLWRRTKKPGSSWNFNKNKPVTTQQKIKAAEAIRRTQECVEGGVVLRYGDKVPGLMTQLQAQADAQAAQSASTNQKPERESILRRQTERSRRWLLRYPAHVPKPTAEDGIFRLRDLPAEIRLLIWRFVVVDTEHFIWPDTPTGREQPDLAMVCKQIRAEVLPIYYCENIFAVSISPSKQFSRVTYSFPQARPNYGAAAIQKLGRVLEDETIENGAWFGQIKNWVFVHEDPNVGIYRRRNDSEDESVFIFIRFIRDRNTGAWFAPEIHQEARCILPGQKQYGQCSLTIRETEKIYDIVIRAQDRVQAKGGVEVATIMELAVKFRGMAQSLAFARCRRQKTTKKAENGVSVA